MLPGAVKFQDGAALHARRPLDVDTAKQIAGPGTDGATHVERMGLVHTAHIERAAKTTEHVPARPGRDGFTQGLGAIGVKKRRWLALIELGQDFTAVVEFDGEGRIETFHNSSGGFRGRNGALGEPGPGGFVVENAGDVAGLPASGGEPLLDGGLGVATVK